MVRGVAPRSAFGRYACSATRSLNRRRAGARQPGRRWRLVRDVAPRSAFGHYACSATRSLNRRRAGARQPMEVRRPGLGCSAPIRVRALHLLPEADPNRRRAGARQPMEMRRPSLGCSAPALRQLRSSSCNRRRARTRIGDRGSTSQRAYCNRNPAARSPSSTRRARLSSPPSVKLIFHRSTR